jgi:hypothetical protein
LCSNPDADVASAALPGTLVVRLDPGGGYLWGWAAEIEVDLAEGAARLCRLRITDVIWDDPAGVQPACATSGSLALNRSPAAEAELIGLAGSIDATFADGLRIPAEFVIE